MLQAASQSVKRTHLELGGKAPVIVFDDADLQSVVAGIRTFGFYNAGQDCTAACRIYAGPKVYDRLVADLSSAVSSIKVGTQQEEGVEMGPLISEQAAPARGGLRGAGLAAEAHRDHRGRQDGRRQGLLLRAHRGGGCPGRTTRSSAARCSARSSR